MQRKQQKGYIDSMRAYTELIGKTPEQLINESEEDIKSGTLMREDALITYRKKDSIKKIFHSSNGVKNYIFANFDRINSSIVAKWNGIT